MTVISLETILKEKIEFLKLQVKSRDELIKKLQKDALKHIEF